jgi:hypothetical protein
MKFTADAHGLPGFLRRHLVTILVLCAMLAVATSLAMW